MKRTIFPIFALFILTFTAFGTETVDRIAAVVNNKIITFNELKTEMMKAAPSLGYDVGQGKKLLSNKKLMKETLDQMINNIMIKEEIKKRGIEVSDQELNMFIRNVMAQNRIQTMSDFLSALALQGLTLEEYKESLRKQAEKTKVMNFAVRAKVNISDQDLKNYYMKNMEESRAPDAVHLKNIFISANKANRKKRKALSEKIRKQLISGTKFATLAKKHSEDSNAKAGGDLGFLTSKDLNPGIYTAVKNLKSGRVSRIIENKSGFYIFKIVGKKKGEIQSFDEVKESLRAKLTNQEMETYFKRWLTELRSHSHIDIKISI